MSQAQTSTAQTTLEAPAPPDLGRAKNATRANTSWSRAIHNPRVIASGIFLLLMAIIAIAAPVISPHDPAAQDAQPLLGPGGHYLLGTDDFGRDVLSRLIYAGRVSLGVSAASVVIATCIGVWLGLFAGYYRGWVDTIIMRAMDVLLSFPTIVLAIAIVAALGASIRNVIIVIAIVYIPRFVRIVYGSTLSAARAEYIDAARVIGVGNLRIIRTAILPNVAAPILVQISLSLGFAILVETGLSFLGLGAQPPTPSWGSMVSDARPFMETNPWLLIAPSLAIGLTILSLNTLGDGLRDALDPRLRNTGV